MSQRRSIIADNCDLSKLLTDVQAEPLSGEQIQTLQDHIAVLSSKIEKLESDIEKLRHKLTVSFGGGW